MSAYPFSEEHFRYCCLQVLEAAPLASTTQLPPPSAPPAVIPAGSPAVSQYLPPSYGSGWGAAVARWLLGGTPPLRLRGAAAPTCAQAAASTGLLQQPRQQPQRGQQHECWLPAVVALGPEQGPGGPLEPDVVRAGAQGVSLWRGEAAGRLLLVVSDPRCCHVLR